MELEREARPVRGKSGSSSRGRSYSKRSQSSVIPGVLRYGGETGDTQEGQ